LFRGAVRLCNFPSHWACGPQPRSSRAGESTDLLRARALAARGGTPRIPQMTSRDPHVDGKWARSAGVQRDAPSGHGAFVNPGPRLLVHVSVRSQLELSRVRQRVARRKLSNFLAVNAEEEADVVPSDNVAQDLIEFEEVEQVKSGHGKDADHHGTHAAENGSKNQSPERGRHDPQGLAELVCSVLRVTAAMPPALTCRCSLMLTAPLELHSPFSTHRPGNAPRKAQGHTGGIKNNER
jgi:hypothetical protein